MPAELGQMQVGRRGYALIGGDVALQAAARVGSVVAALTITACPSEARQAGSANASSACWRKLSRGTTQQTRSMSPAARRADDAITGSSDLPPPGVTAARMSVTPEASPEAMARTTAAIWD